MRFLSFFIAASLLWCHAALAQIPGTSGAATSVTAGTTLCSGCAANGILDASGNPLVVTSLATANNGVLVTDGTGVPSIQPFLFFPSNDSGGRGASIGVGLSALANQTGASAAYANVAVGFGAIGGATLTTAAVQNVAIGTSALTYLTTGNSNFGLGYSALLFNQTGSYNICIGSQACSGNGSPSYNVAIGGLVASALTTGIQNILVGFGVGVTAPTTGSRNILFGVNTNCVTAAAGTNDTFQVCASTGATPLMSGNTAAGSLALTVNGNFINTLGIADQGYSYTTPTAGGTVTLLSTSYHAIIDPAGTLATLTINMPVSPLDGQYVDVRFSQVVTALTVSGNGNSIAGNPTSAAVGSQFSCIFRATGTKWFC